jgi:hypothetical protein
MLAASVIHVELGSFDYLYAIMYPLWEQSSFYPVTTLV